MVNVDLTPTELAMVISRVDRYPTHVSSMEQKLVAKLREAVPAPTVEISLSRGDIDRLTYWVSMLPESHFDETLDTLLVERLDDARDRLLDNSRADR